MSELRPNNEFAILHPLMRQARAAQLRDIAAKTIYGFDDATRTRMDSVWRR